jgi:hypothetical protein
MVHEGAAEARMKSDGGLVDFGRSTSHEEATMRRKYMSTHNGNFASVVKGMTLRANAQPWHPGACRRR